MFSKFDEEAQKVIISAKKEMQELKHPYVGSEHLTLAILKGKNEVSTKLKELGIDYKKFKNEIINIIGIGSIESNWFLYTPLLKRTLESAVSNVRDNNNEYVTVVDLFYSILEEGEGVAIRILLSMNVDIDKLYNYFSKNIIKKKQNRKKSILDELGIDLNNKAKDNELDPVIGREKEINRLLEILCRRTKNNPILIGDAGVGKTAIVEELANRIVSGNVPKLLKNKRIISLDMASSVAGTKYRGEFEDRMKKILSELEDNSDIILFIDEIHTIMGAGGAEGAIDASNIFKPALARGKMRCIGATTKDEYKKFIENDSALDRRFQKIEVKMPDEITVKNILMKLKPLYEKHHNVSINESMIEKIIKFSKRYIKDRNEPDRSIDILDEVCAKVSLKESDRDKKLKNLYNSLEDINHRKNNLIIENHFDEAYVLKQEEDKIKTEINTLELECNTKNKEVIEDDVLEVIKSKIEIPILNINNDTLVEIDKKLKENIYGQDSAINELLNISRRMQLNYDNSKNISLLFCGSSGVGKTKLAKLYGEELVGKENVIKLDMSEFSESHTISKIIGAPPGYVGYTDSKNMLEEIKDKPNSVIILDEIERCHKSVRNLFLQILDEGYTKDSRGKKIYFDDVTIIMTSNIGFNKNSMGFNNRNNNSTKLKDVLGIEFVNRISKTIFFNKLDEENIKKIVNNNIDNLRKKYNINLDVSSDVIKKIIDDSEYEVFGARKVEELIIENVESVIIDEVINGNKVISIEKLKDMVNS